MVVLVNNNTW